MTASVGLTRCTTYELPALRRAVRECVEAVGEAASLLGSAKRVLLKPNIVSPRAPERAVCTHPAVLRAVAEIVVETGAELIVADQPTYYLAGRADHVFAAAGYVDALEGIDARFMLLGSAGYSAVELARYNQWRHIHSADLLRQVDLVINLPKAKTHVQTLFSGAVKNMFGALAPRQRMEMHALGSFRAVSGSVADAFAAFVPQLNLMDGILGMEGPGPSQGTPRPWGVLAASTDAVALDAVVADLVGFGPGEVLVTALAAQIGCGEADLSRIQTIGAAPDELRTRFVRPPQLMRQFPAFLGKLGRRLMYIRPRVDRKRCIRCGGCAKVCPAAAITINNYAVIDVSRCIECFCCTEACPQDAISVHPSLLTRLM